MVNGVIRDVATAEAKASSLGLHESYTPYPTYKPSGVEWLGEIPGHWVTLRLKYAATLNPTVSEVRRLAPDTEVS